MKLPKRLSRKAIIQNFTKLSEARWEYLFDHEKDNGIHEYRVDGPFKKAYYDTEGILCWLVMEGVYKVADFNGTTPATGWGGLSVKTHALG